MNRLKRLCWLAAVAMAGLAGPAQAKDQPQPIWAGIWAGTIGSDAVRLCLVDKRYTAIPFGGVGSFFLMKDRVAQRLEQNGPKSWAEGWGDTPDAKANRWEWDRIGTNALVGRRLIDGISVPVKLTRLSRETDCGADAFARPLFDRIVVREEPAAINGAPYVKLTAIAGAHLDLSLEGFALAAATPQERRVNALLRALLPLAPRRNAAFDCVRGGLSAQGNPGDYGVTVEPVFITPEWLSARASVGGYCGGAHPFSSQTMLAYDLRKGSAVDLFSWLAPRALGRKEYGQQPLSAEFRAVIMRRWPKEADNEDCREAAAQEANWSIGMERTGLIFTPWMAHAMKPCEEPVLVRFDVLQPFLSGAGKAGVASLQRNLAPQ